MGFPLDKAKPQYEKSNCDKSNCNKKIRYRKETLTDEGDNRMTIE